MSQDDVQNRLCEPTAADIIRDRRGTPLLVVLSGPSGVGKDALLQRMREMGRPYYITVTATTRPQRPGERDGADYFFIDRDRFESMIEQGEFLEWANVYGNLYGVPRKQVTEQLSQGRDVVIKADVQGAAHIRSIEPDAVLIFLAPPSMDELEGRLKQRQTEDAIDFSRRIETAKLEMEEIDKFDYVVVNERDRLDQAVAEVDAIILSEKCRVKPRVLRLRQS